jgi:ribosome-binding ATPase YchF (GTP1/OBG family)
VLQGLADAALLAAPLLVSPSLLQSGRLVSSRAAGRSRRDGLRVRFGAVALEVGIVGLPNAGKTTLFNALTKAGAEITAYASQTDKANVGMATIADERLGRLAELVQAKKVTPAAIRVQDVPGTGPALLGGLRQVDALLAVADGFSPDADPQRDLEQLQLELLVADTDHVAKRLERVEKQAKSGDAALRKEVEQLRDVLAHLEAGRPLSEWPHALPSELDPLTTKPTIAIVNGPDGIDCKLEAELAELPDEEAEAFRDGPSALDEVVRRLKDALGLITFFTAGEKETRAWTLRDGQSALEAAGTIHSDIARGFIRCEVIRWDDLLDAGSHAEAQRRGTQRLEGKTYVVQDGDVLNIRFNV